MASATPSRWYRDAEQAVLKQGKLFEERQKKSLPLYDTILYKVNVYRAAPTNVLEADIKNDIRTLNDYYNARES